VKKLVGITIVFKNDVRMMKNGIIVVIKGVATPTKKRAQIVFN
jgi:hypothetical protein